MRRAERSVGPLLVFLPVLLALVGCGSNDAAAPTSADACAFQRSGSACTWLGVKHAEGFNGDGLRYETSLNQVQDVLFLPDGTAWFTDFNNHLVRKVLPNDEVATVVGWTDPIFPGDGPFGGTPEGGAPGAEWQLFHPTGLALGADGGVVAVGWHNHKILTIDPNSGWVTVLAGGAGETGRSGFDGDGGPASLALFNQPSDVALDDSGNVYITDQVNLRVRRIDTNDDIDTIAGTGEYGSAGDGGPAVDAEMAWASGANPNPSGGVVYQDGRLYIADTENNRVRAIDLATGQMQGFAGNGERGYGGDGGPALNAMLNGPRDLEIGPEGDLYVADTDNGVVRAIERNTGVIRSVVGTGELGLDEEEQLPASETRLRRPFGIAFDAAGNLYVADSLNNRVVRVAR